MKNESLDGRRDINEFILSELNKLSDGSLVLDAGAGDPAYQVRTPGHRYLTVDLCVGDKSWDYHGTDIVGNLEKIPIRDNAVDAVICTQTIEHMSEPEQVLKELQRVLKPGGRIFLTAPQEWYMHQIPYDFYRFTRYGLEHLFRKAGFHIESIDPMGGYFRLLAFKLSYLKYIIFPPVKSLPVKIVRWPFKYPFIFMFEFFIPFFLGVCDRFDKNKYDTMGYKVVGTKK
jgi:SAM-dependent methyltransferase